MALGTKDRHYGFPKKTRCANQHGSFALTHSIPRLEVQRRDTKTRKIFGNGSMQAVPEKFDVTAVVMRQVKNGGDLKTNPILLFGC